MKKYKIPKLELSILFEQYITYLFKISIILLENKYMKFCYYSKIFINFIQYFWLKLSKLNFNKYFYYFVY